MKENQNVQISFEDHGQDFLIWVIDSNGNIIDCTPFQYGIWSHWQVTNYSELQVGGAVTIRNRRYPKEEKTVSYSIEKLENMDNDYRQCKNCGATVRDLEMKDEKCPDCGSSEFHSQVQKFN